MSRRQLLEAGLSDSAISKRVARGRLHRVHHAVYAVGHRGLSQHGRWMAAVLAAGEGAVLSQLSAAALWRITRHAWAADRIDVTTRRGRRSRRHVHTSRSLDRRDVTVRDGIPVTSVARTLVDLADVLDAHQLANVIHEAAFLNRLEVPATRAAMARANGRRRLGVLTAALELHASGSAGTRSALEDRFLALIGAAGVPQPLVNVGIQAGGQRIEVDFHWTDCHLCVEVDGPGHARPGARHDDRVRDELLRAAGYEVLRFTGEELRRRPDWVLAELQAYRQVPRRTMVAPSWTATG